MVINISDTKQLTVKLALQAGNYKQQIKSINTQNRALQTEFKNISSTSKDFEKSLEGKQAKLKLLGTQLENAKKKVSIYQTQVEKCKTTLDDATTAYTSQEEKVKNLSQQLDEAKVTYGENSDEVKTLKQELKDAEKVLESKRNAVINADNSLTNMNTTLDNAQTEVKRLQSEFEQCEKTANDFSNKMQTVSTAATKFSTNLEKGGKAIQNTGKVISVASAAVTAIGVSSIKTAADFESAMSQVAATMGMTAEEINNGSEDYKLLEEAAKEMGRTTMYSASQAAEALNYLALAGYDAKSAVETLPTILNVAAAGGMELAAASDLVTDAMSALGDKAGAVEEFGDKLAKTSQKSNTNVAQLGEGILTIGATAQSIKGGMTELSTALGILADSGIKASEGGTALRNVLLNLSEPRNDAAAAMMEELGVSAWDASGNMRPLNETLLDLNNAMAGMTAQEKSSVITTIFNKVDLASVNTLLANVTVNTSNVKDALDEMGVSTESISSKIDELGVNFTATTDRTEFIKTAMDSLGITTEQAGVVFDEFTKSLSEGSRWEQLSGYIDNSKGAAENMAETMQNNLNGAITELSSAFEGVQIVIGNYFIPFIKKATEALTNLATWFTNLSPAFQNIAIGVGIFIAALGPLLLIIGTLILSIGQIAGAIGVFTEAIATAGSFSAWFSTTLTPILVSIGTVIAVVVAVALAIKENWEGIKNATLNLVNQCSPYFEQFKLAFSQLWETCQSIYATIIQPLFKMLGEVIAICISAAIPIIQSLLTAFTIVINTINTVWATVGQPIFAFIISVIQDMWGIVQPIFLNIISVFSSVCAAISSSWSGVLYPVFQIIMNAVKSLGTMFSVIFNAIRVVVTTAFAAMTAPIQIIITAFKSFMALVKSVSTAVSGAINTMKTNVINAMNAMLAPIKNVADKLGALASKVKDTASSIGGKLTSLFRGKSIDISTNMSLKETPVNQSVAAFSSMARSIAPLDNIAMSGSYYSSATPAVATLSTASTYASSIAGSGINALSGRFVNTKVQSNDALNQVTSLLSNMIEILVNQNDLLNLNNNLVEANKPVFKVDGQQLSNKLDNISGKNLKLMERFNL